MRGLEEILRLNDIEAARAWSSRYRKLCARAVRRQDWDRAKRYDGQAEDFRRFAEGQIKVWPSRANRKARLFVPTVGRDFQATGGQST